MHPEPGLCTISLIHADDLIGHAAVVEWGADGATITRHASGGRPPRREADPGEVTFHALLSLVAGGHAPVPDFDLLIQAREGTSGQAASRRVVVRDGQATMADAFDPGAAPTPLPAWFAEQLYELFLGDLTYPDGYDAEPAEAAD